MEWNLIHLKTNRAILQKSQVWHALVASMSETELGAISDLILVVVSSGNGPLPWTSIRVIKTVLYAAGICFPGVKAPNRVSFVTKSI